MNNLLAWVAIALAITSIVLAIVSIAMTAPTRPRRKGREVADLSPAELEKIRRFGLDTPDGSDG